MADRLVLSSSRTAEAWTFPSPPFPYPRHWPRSGTRTGRAQPRRSQFLPSRSPPRVSAPSDRPSSPATTAHRAATRSETYPAKLALNIYFSTHGLEWQ